MNKSNSLNRRSFLAKSATALAAVPYIVMETALGRGGKVASAAEGSEGKDSRPNIVLIISDDHGLADSNCYGNKAVRTPNIDRIANEGVRFDFAFCASTLCSPARAVIDSGLMPFRNGGHVFGGYVKPDIKTLAKYFNEIGYQTALFGKFSMHPNASFPYEVVMKQWKPADHDVGLVDGLDKFLAKRKTDRPLLLEINTADTHQPWFENEGYDLGKIKVPPYLIDTPETRDALADYYSSVNSLDKTIGNILNVLDKHGYNKNTVLIYTSDHGPNLAFAKWCIYDTGIRVPFLVRWPGVVKANTSTDAMISHADIMPTLLEAAGGAVCENLDGKSLLALLKGQKTTHRDVIFATHTGQRRQYPAWKLNKCPARTIRTKTHKYILNLNPTAKFITHITACNAKRQPSAYHPYWESWVKLAKTNASAKKRVDEYYYRPQHELYDLRKDPFELENIADRPENAELLKSLQEQLKAWREKQGDTVPVCLDGSYVSPNR